MGRVFAFAIHADYGCRQTGRCCLAGWDVPVEMRPLRLMRAAATAGRLILPPDPFIEGQSLPAGAAAILRQTEAGACVLEDPVSNLCTAHTALGPSVLPAACQ